MKATKIKLGDIKVAKWGLVTFINEDTTIARQYRITGKEAENVHHGGALPPGCTKAEWETGRVMVASRPCFEWDAVINPDRTLVINYGIHEADGLVQVSLAKCQPLEWELRDDIIYLDDDLARKIGA